jgi:signal transduction histidine kinase
MTDSTLMDFITGDQSVSELFDTIWEEIGLLPDHRDSLQAATQTLNTNIEALRNLHHVSQKLTATSTPADIINAIEAHPLFAQAASIGLLGFDKPWQTERPSTISVLHSTGGLSAFDEHPLEDYPFADDLTRRKPLFLTEEELKERPTPRLDTHDTRQLISFPLVSVGKWFGLLNLHATEPEVWARDELNVMQPVVNQVAIVTSNIKFHHESEQNDELFADLAGIVHELRNPLTSILGFSDTLLQDDIDWDIASQRDFLQTINVEAHRLATLLEHLLDFTRMEAQAFSLNNAPTTFSEVLTSVMSNLEWLTEGYTLTITLADNLPDIDVDVVRIGQVLTNLVENATKYTPEGTTITIEAAPHDDMLRVCVSDEGPGIKPEDCERIFEPFQRGSVTLNKPGSGLGLSICKGIITAHGGVIKVEQEPEGQNGATFCFTLPTV